MRLFIASPVILDNYASIKEDFKDIIEGRWTEKNGDEATFLTLYSLLTTPPPSQTFP